MSKCQMVFQNFPKWSDMVVHEIITAHFEGHIGPVSRPYWTSFEATSIPGAAATSAATAAAFVFVNVMVADSMIYKDRFY